MGCAPWEKASEHAGRFFSLWGTARESSQRSQSSLKTLNDSLPGCLSSFINDNFWFMVCFIPELFLVSFSPGLLLLFSTLPFAVPQVPVPYPHLWAPGCSHSIGAPVSLQEPGNVLAAMLGVRAAWEGTPPAPVPSARAAVTETALHCPLFTDHAPTADVWGARSLPLSPQTDGCLLFLCSLIEERRPQLILWQAQKMQESA